jgi:hypothetical protein
MGDPCRLACRQAAAATSIAAAAAAAATSIAATAAAAVAGCDVAAVERRFFIQLSHLKLSDCKLICRQISILSILVLVVNVVANVHPLAWERGSFHGGSRRSSHRRGCPRNRRT